MYLHRGQHGTLCSAFLGGLGWVLPPLSNSWIIIILWVYIALNRTPNIDCYWGGGSTQGLGILWARVGFEIRDPLVGLGFFGVVDEFWSMENFLPASMNLRFLEIIELSNFTRGFSNAIS